MQAKDNNRNTPAWGVVVIGSGPAGLAAASAAAHGAHRVHGVHGVHGVNGVKGARSCIIEREERPGGILKQCIHDGFGLIRYQERLTGPEYAWRELQRVNELGIPIFLSTYLDSVSRSATGFRLSGVSPRGTFCMEAGSIILATGCRERTARQIFLHGSRPAGVYTAGLAQYFINIQGYLPARRCVILGSGDIGLIMARRLVLEGAEVEGVYEIMPQPSGLPRNLSQCLDDYHIPLHLSTTVTKVHGQDRLEGVTTMQVDSELKPVPGTEKYIACDSLILSVGLIPENEIAAELGAEIDPLTRGPVVNDAMMSTVPGLFSCGNALHVSDLVDYVSETGEKAGAAAADFELHPEEDIPFDFSPPIAYIVPQRVRAKTLSGQDAPTDGVSEPLNMYFRVKRAVGSCRLRIVGHTERNGRFTIYSRKFRGLRPAEMERVEIQLSERMSERNLSGGAAELVRLEAVVEEVQE